MQIIHLTLGKANPERMNGVNKVAYELARHQHALGAEVSIWGLTHNTIHDYPAREFPTVLFQRRRWALPIGLAAAVRALPQDTVVHLHGMFIPALDRVAKLLQKAHIPYLITPHGALAKAAMAQNAWVKQWYFRLISKRSLRTAASVQTLGVSEHSDFAELAPGIPQVLIPNGQDMNEIPVLSARPGNAFPVFGFCGRLDRYHKGLDLMLDAFRELRTKGHQAKLLLIGDGADRSWLENYCATNGLIDVVKFCGARYGQEKFAYLRRCDFFLHTSRMEGFPVAVLEAAALGLPCLTTPATSMNPYLEAHDAGFPISELSIDAILAAMEAACDVHASARYAELVRNCQQMVQQAFDWQDIANQLLWVYVSFQATKTATHLKPQLNIQ